MTEPPVAEGTTARPRRIVVVGSGTHFLSGVSVHTIRLANAFAERGHRVGLVTMRRVIPRRLYPGRARVGANLTALQASERVAHYDGIDWFWIPSMLRAAVFLMRRRPEIVVFQWWTGAVVHSYLALALLARLAGARVIVEFHEILAVEELRIPMVGRYVRAFAPLFFRLAGGYAFHSDFDRELASATWRLEGPRAVTWLGPHDLEPDRAAGEPAAPLREAPPGVINVLFFGVIREYKGLEHLVAAFEQIPEAEQDRFWLTVVGETWEGYTRPIEMIEASRRRARMTLVNRYVTDTELDGYLRGADAVALPYVRSSISAPLHVAMSYGLPVVMTDTGGNAEAARGYAGLTLVPPADVNAIAAGLRQLPGLMGQRFIQPQSWGNTVAAYERLFTEVHKSSQD